MTATVFRGWAGLLAISQDARQYRAELLTQRPIACPNDGEPLQPDATGRLRCVFDGWTESDDPSWR